MKIALAQQNYHIGNFEDNTQKILQQLRWQKINRQMLLFFQSYVFAVILHGILLNSTILLINVMNAIEVIKAHTENIAVIVGSPERNSIKEGKGFV